jgi:hypothetical protein
MAPEQIQSCIDACNLCAEACEQQLRTLSNRHIETKPAANLIRDCAALCRVTAASLSGVSEASGLLCAACARLCNMAAQACEKEEEEEEEEAAQCVRAARHCAKECDHMAGGMPHTTALA